VESVTPACENNTFFHKVIVFPGFPEVIRIPKAPYREKPAPYFFSKRNILPNGRFFRLVSYVWVTMNPNTLLISLKSVGQGGFLFPKPINSGIFRNCIIYAALGNIRDLL